ncbi:transcription antitermination protein BlgG [Erysipelotrichaceae bacterium]|nr:transcription antitermination protein BlgG [Erysipelotrichaceae bacterium]
MYLTRRQSDILLYLLANKTVHISKLSKDLAFSTKTIRKEIRILDGMLAPYHSKIVRNDTKMLTFETEKTHAWWIHKIPQMQAFTVEQRIKLYLLWSEKTTTIQELSDALFYTKSAVEKLLASTAFATFPLNKRRNVGISYSGTDSQRLLAIIALLGQVVFYNGLLLQMLEVLETIPIPQYNAAVVRALYVAIHSFFEEAVDVTYSDSSKKQLFIALVALVFLKSTSEVIEVDAETQRLRMHITNIVPLGNHVLVAKIVADLRKKMAGEKQDQEQTAKVLCERMIIVVEQGLQIELLTEELLKKRLVQHIADTLMHTTKSKDEGMMDQSHLQIMAMFRVRYALAFEAGKLAITVLEQHIGYLLQTDVEVLYLGLYFQLLFDFTESYEQEGLLVAIICEHGFGLSHFIGERLQRHFLEIQTVRCNSVFELLHQPEIFMEVDMIFSTIDGLHVSGDLAEKFFSISPLLDNTDIAEITRYLASGSKKQYFRELAYPIIEIKGSYQSKEQLLRQITAKLIDAKYVTAQYHTSLMEREEIAPTGFGSLAIPHGAVAHVLKSTVVIVTLLQPLAWGDANVELVCLFVATKSDLRAKKQQIGQLYQALADDNYVKKIVEQQTKAGVIKLLQQ